MFVDPLLFPCEEFSFPNKRCVDRYEEEEEDYEYEEEDEEC
jgi:hypothetical protein